MPNVINEETKVPMKWFMGSVVSCVTICTAAALAFNEMRNDISDIKKKLDRQIVSKMYLRDIMDDMRESNKGMGLIVPKIALDGIESAGAETALPIRHQMR